MQWTQKIRGQAAPEKNAAGQLATVRRTQRPVHSSGKRKAGRFRLILQGSMACIAGAVMQAKAIDIADVPLSDTLSSIPNVLLMLDDSGSMGFDTLTKRHYSYCAYTHAKLPALIDDVNLDDYLDSSVVSDELSGQSGDKAVCFYHNKNFTGQANCFDGSAATLSSASQNQWESVELRLGYAVKVFKESNYEGSSSTGAAIDIVASRYDMPATFGNQIESFQLYRTHEHPSPKTKPVCFYEHANFEGRQTCYASSGYSGQGASQPNKWSSVKIQAGYAVRVYKGSSRSGASTTLNTSQTYLDDGFNDEIESFTLMAAAANPANKSICFYENALYTGAKTCYTGSRGQVGDKANRWSSVEVPDGMNVRLFKGSRYRGDYIDVSADAPLLTGAGFSNEVESFQINRSHTAPYVSAYRYRTHDCPTEINTGNFYPGLTLDYNRVINIHLGNLNLREEYTLEGEHGPLNNIDYFETEGGDWRIFSRDFNTVYYDPDATYAPWTPSYSNASFTAARHDGEGADIIPSKPSTIDLTGSLYVLASDDAGFSETNAAGNRTAPNQKKANYTTGANGLIDGWDNHVIYQINSSHIARWRVTFEYADDHIGPRVRRKVDRLSDITNAAEVARTQQNFANWFEYGRRRYHVANTALADLLGNSPNYRYAYGLINDSSLPRAPADNSDLASHTADILDYHLQNYQPFAGGTPLREALHRAGYYFRETGDDAPVTEACQQNYTLLFTDGYWHQGFSSGVVSDDDGDGYALTLADVATYHYANDLRPDLDNRVFASTDNPAVHQHMVTIPVSFGLQGLLTDSNADGWPDSSGIQLQASDDWGDPFAGQAQKVDDLWHAAWNSRGEYISAANPTELIKRLSNSLALVSSRIGSRARSIVNSTSLSKDGFLYQGTYNTDDWTGNLQAFSRDASGQILPTPAWDAAKQLASSSASRVVLTLDTNSAGVTRGAAFTKNTLSTDYREKLAVNREELGIVGGADAFADTLIDYIRGDSGEEGGTPQTSWTFCASENNTCTVPEETTVRFGKNDSWYSQVVSGSVPCTQTFFGDPLSGVVKQCEYAVTSGYGLRPRNSLLGDIIHSEPVYVGRPSLFLNDTAYQSFASRHASRKEMVYVGANDGMLHGFNALTGKEELAYVPRTLANQLYRLADSDYSHRYFVDGTVTVGDACIGSTNCTWKTIATGSLGAGGRAVYALDVSDPSTFTESNASGVAQWEFSSADDGDLGYSLGRPLLVKLATGRWAVIVANGYNSDSGEAILFVLDAQTGQPLTAGGKLSTGSGDTATPNGLSSPTAVDTDQDGDVDAVYAGDLRGNLWKFDLSHTDASKWGVPYQASSTPLPLFAGGSDTPITTAPQVGRHPDEPGYMVYFGTGKYLELTDNSAVGQATQSLYGIWDDNRAASAFTAAIAPDDLLEQTITEEVSLYPNDTNSDGLHNGLDAAVQIRLTSRNQICWKDCTAGASAHRGWRMPLELAGNNRGERQVTNALLQKGRIIFVTWLPSADTCTPDGTSWLMELSARDGSALQVTPFDLNGDGKIDGDDVDYSEAVDGSSESYCTAGDCLSPSGLKFQKKVQSPVLAKCGNGNCKYLSTSDGTVEKTADRSVVNLQGRQSWRLLDSN